MTPPLEARPLLRRLRLRLRLRSILQRSRNVAGWFLATGYSTLVALASAAFVMYWVATGRFGVGWAVSLSLPLPVVVVGVGTAVVLGVIAVFLASGFGLARLYERSFTDSAEGGWLWENRLLADPHLPWEVVCELAFHPDPEISLRARQIFTHRALESMLYPLSAKLLTCSDSATELRQAVLAVYDPSA